MGPGDSRKGGHRDFINTETGQRHRRRQCGGQGFGMVVFASVLMPVGSPRSPSHFGASWSATCGLGGSFLGCSLGGGLGGRWFAVAVRDASECLLGPSALVIIAADVVALWGLCVYGSRGTWTPSRSNSATPGPVVAGEGAAFREESGGPGRPGERDGTCSITRRTRAGFPGSDWAPARPGPLALTTQAGRLRPRRNAATDSGIRTGQEPRWGPGNGDGMAAVEIVSMPAERITTAGWVTGLRAMAGRAGALDDRRVVLRRPRAQRLRPDR